MSTPIRVIVVDDDASIRDAIADHLLLHGYQVRLAADAAALDVLLQAERPDLIILDIWLKDSRMDGIDILKAVKREHPEVPIVIISGHGNIETAVAAILASTWSRR